MFVRDHVKVRCGLLLLALTSAGCGDDECSLDAYVDRFRAENDPLECQFAHRYMPDDRMIGAEGVHECIVDAMANARAFVGGFHLGVEESIQTHVYLGTSDGNSVEMMRAHGFDGDGVEFDVLDRRSCGPLYPGTKDYNQDVGFLCISEVPIDRLCTVTP
jgi:hypothetical protein